MGNNSWKSRGTYGAILYRKIKKLNRKFTAEINSEHPDHMLLFNYSKALDYSIQTQLSNINRIEEFEMLQVMEGKIDSGYSKTISEMVTTPEQAKF